MAFDLTDASVWHHAIRRLKATAAVGVCGWHNAELKALPDVAVESLAKMLGSLTAPSFPAHLLQAKVAALSKVAAPTSAAQARPITIMSCLYRLWGRVVCLHAIRRWSLVLPRPIMGFLKGRSAVDLSYWMRQEIEQALHWGHELSGVALDLRKAFNLIPRQPARHLLRLLGLPPAITDFWLKGLPLIRRSFSVGGTLSPGLGSTTGAPEGDPMSVLSMLAICYAFVAVVQPFAEPRCYADNWSWLTDLPDAHAPALEAVCGLADSLSMEFDWGKSYFWSTSRETRVWWKKNSPFLLPPGAFIGVVSQVKELGAHMSFGRKMTLGHLPGQFQSAVDRLHRLFHEPSSVSTKSRLVEVGIWPHAFFGALGCAPGLHRMQYLRGNAARAIVGRHHTLSSHAALHLLPHVQDPEVYLMSAQAAQLRRAFDCMEPVANAVLALATSDYDFQSVYGPATALRCMFGRNGWCLHSDGLAKGPGHAFFNFKTSAPSAIRLAIQSAWAHTVQEACLHRSGLLRLQPPCPLLSRDLLTPLPAWKQSILARHMTGAYMSGAEKAVWSKVDDGTCPLCGALDTKGHRLFGCPAMADIRRPYEPLLHTVQTDFPEWAHLFVGTEHEQQAFLRLVTSARTLPPLLPAPPGVSRLTLFTDGSARFSNCPPARLTYWSVVMAPCFASSADMDAWCALSPALRAASFRVLVQGSTPGCQTIPRAELAAVSWVASWLSAHPHLGAEVFTDSAYVVHIWQTLQATRSLASLGGDVDLAASLLHCPNMSVTKVKAHNPLGHLSTASSRLRFHTEGNEAADAAAKSAARQEAPYVVRAAEDVHEHFLYQQSHMTLFAEYLVEVNVHYNRRKDALVQSGDFEPQYDASRARRDLFAPPTAARLEDTFQQFCGQPHRICGLPFGDSFMLQLHRWAATLRWPNLPLKPEHEGVITFVELTVRFCLWAGSLPPVVIHGGSTRRFVPSDSEQGRLQRQDLWSTTAVFQEAVEVAAKRGLHLLPAARVVQIPQLRALGLQWNLPGLSIRPVLPTCARSEEVLSLVCEHGNIQALVSALA